MEVLSGLSAALDELAQLDPAVLGDGATLVALEREVERLNAMRSRATAAFDASPGRQPQSVAGEWRSGSAGCIAGQAVAVAGTLSRDRGVAQW